MNLERWPSVHSLVMGNWSVYQSLKRSVPGLMDASRPMLDDLLADCERRGVDPVWRWFWDGDIPGRNFARAMRRLADEYPTVKFWCYTRSYEVVPLLACRVAAEHIGNHPPRYTHKTTTNQDRRMT